MFAYICRGFEEGREPNFNTFSALVADHGIGLNDHDIFELTCLEPDPDVTLHELCEIVASNGWRRDHARELLGEVDVLLRGQPEMTIETDDLTETTIVHHRKHRKGFRRGKRNETAV
jgi:hypothetical protein